uniref:Uncharacterized protein MANES_05G172300 n=1 Tax=Rhizophora mucronata TaxID=61149 RepID=A0A2P2PKF2_RHIMU
MDAQQHRNTREKAGNRPEEEKIKQEAAKEVTTPTTTTPPASPPSATSSPSHEFSFTISQGSSSAQVPDKTSKAPSSSFAIDLSPADDIFFHGHLLPLHLLSQLPVSPRTSTNSMDSFTHPVRELIDHQKPTKSSGNCITSDGMNENGNESKHFQSNDCRKTKGRSKPKSFSLFGWKKACEVGEREDKEKHKKRLRFDVSQVLKRYVSMIRPLLLFRGRRENLRFHRQAYSFSGHWNTRYKQDLPGRRGEFSAPASMRTSPTNSGLLLATPAFSPPASDSTMEELQSAIQAAIAHCKKSIGAEEKIKC